jgi:uncharacterized membrane protein YjgN (DUF898 family)
MREMINNTFYGTQHFRYTGKGKDLFISYLFAYVLFPFTLGLSYFWYSARAKRYHLNHTYFGSATFDIDMTGSDYLVLFLKNTFLILLTAGIATPWVIVGNLNFIMSRLKILGSIEFSQVEQVEEEGYASANDIVESLGVDFGL